jgi:hypothetical protein
MQDNEDEEKLSDADDTGTDPGTHRSSRKGEHRLARRKCNAEARECGPEGQIEN